MPYSFNPLSGLGLDQSIPLDGAGKIPSDYLPSYVDDVEEYADLASFPATGETGKIYVAIDTGFTYRWSGSAYVRINSLDSITGDVDVAADGTSSIASGVIVDGDVNASAAIAGTKIDPDFGSQTVETTGVINAGSGTAEAPSVSVGTTDNGLYAPDTDQVAISTNGTGRLFIDASGDIKLGSAAAAGFRLAVDGDAWFGNGFGVELGRLFNDAGVLHLRASSNVTGLALGTNGGEKARIDSSGNLGLGTSSPSSLLHVKSTGAVSAFVEGGGTSGDTVLQIKGNGNDYKFIVPNAASPYGMGLYDVGNAAYRLYVNGAGNVGIGDTGPSETLTVKGASSVDPFSVSGPSSEFLRVDDDGRLLVGTSTAPTTQKLGASFGHSFAASSYLGVVFQANDNSAAGTYLVFKKSRAGSVGGVTVVANGDVLGQLSFEGTDGTSSISAATISAEVDGTPGANDMPGRLVFSTTADGASSPTEQMRISNSGGIYFHATSLPGAGTSTTGVGISGGDALTVHRAAATACYFGRTDDGEVIALYSGTTQRGTVSISGATTTYTSVSDYRLKENIAPITGAASRVSQLKPSKFNFREFPEQTVDGFIAHEVQEVVPECVTGTKDAVDADGNPVYQGIDQSKLVPLLTAALQEALAEIESLKARVTALEQ